MFFRSAKANALNAAQIEGDDVGDIVEREPPREEARVPVALDELYRRLDAALRPYSALVAVPEPQRGVLDEPTFEVYRAQLINHGRVELIDLIKAAREAGVIGETETPIARWTNWPIPR
jgi:hypothetical protein